MVYLPSELWLQILSHSSDTRILWNSVRRANHQLKDCVEQHFADNIMPTIRLELIFKLPCYDGRNPLRGKGIFHFSHLQTQESTGAPERVICALVDVEPEHYMEQLLVRWDRLRESTYGYLPQSLDWKMSIGSPADRGDEVGVREVFLRLKEPVAFSKNEKTTEGSGVGFEWKAAMTSFLS